MNVDEVRRRIAEYAAIRPDAGDDPAALVEAALYIEEVFGVSLTDDDMTEARLGSRAAMERLAIELLELG